MFRNYFKTALRNLQKNKLYSAINIFGLTIGLTACLLIGVYINHELSYDKFNTNANRIVRVTMTYGSAGTDNAVATTGTKVGPQFKRMFPSVEEYARTFISHNVVKSGDKIFDEPRILYADEPFFKMFSFHLVEGDASTALNAPDKIVITQSMAKKYFGKEDALNKTLTSGGKDLRVSAVIEDVPQNSQLKFDFVTQFMNLGNNVKEETWWTANWVTYMLVRDEKNIAQLQQQINDYTKSTALRTDAGLKDNDYLRYTLEPLAKVHLYSSLPGFEPNSSITYIYMFALIALLILIIACANYTNLATAQSAGRSGEIGMRKVMGASKRMVFMQFMGESSVITCIAAILAFVLSILLIPYFNNITGKQFTAEVLLQLLPIIALILFSLAVSFFAGLYPALVLSGTKISGVLKKGFSFTGGSNILRKTLIVAQFGISVFLIIYTIIILQQMHYMQTKNLGYDKDHLVVLPIGGNMTQNFQSLKDAFLQVKGVESVTASYDTPEYVGWGDGITATDEKGKHEISLNAMPVDLDFTKTTKMQLVAGRDFLQSDFALMDTTNNYANYQQPYIINETLAKKIGWTPQESIGRIIENRAMGPVVGVVKDFNFSSLHDPIGPMLIFLGRDFSRNFIIRVNDNDVQSVLARLEMVWKQRVTDRPFNYHFLDDSYNKLYLAEQRTSVLFSMAAALAIILACLGLFGLAAFTTVQRTKEIGIRRVLGANLSSITLLVAKNFLQLVGIAILIAAPLAWWAGNKWLQDYAFRVPIEVYVFIATAIVTVLIALITVSYHSLKAALMNPVKSLRTE
ncbi:FtsX-like permease family protein [Panacibacter ginsenosidivorans]|uniref:FtsX-like permease family protein n=1 Tax=Panacibacter ginsenosidivorans TaxID=1813871 RepID=A0A5B8V447_9BACT|nr:ABC transporter permease [Panacibacter ginsenosidivorans]QEC65982.1 FtsX-like permease family protein [Panacibacter ginsenosidivorans]